MGDLPVDVIVVGAGISGLSAAKLLVESGVDTIVLEARDRVAGRTHTKRNPETYKYVDVGGAYVGPTQDRVLRMAKELGIKTYKVHYKGDNVHFSNGKRYRFTGSWPKFTNPLAWLDVNNLFRKMDELLAEIPLDRPWEAPHAEEWDRTTVKQFYDRVCWTQDAKEFGRAFVNANVTMEPGEISMLWFFWYVKSCGGTQRIWEVENGGQERKFVGGSGQISEFIAEKLGDRVKLNSPVNTISDRAGQVTVGTIDGRKYKARHVILAQSPTLHMKIAFDPPLPPLRQQLIQRIPMGSCIKNMTYYKKPFWRKLGFNGFGSAADGKECVGNIVDDCKPDGSIPCLVGFVMGDQARRLANMTREERMRETCESYARQFGSKEALNPVGYEEGHWMAEEYSAGCYTSTYPPGVMTRFGKTIRDPIGNMYFAATETATEWTGYMDGAIQAGERAAREILCARGVIPREQVWQSEPMSKEVPSKPFYPSFIERNAPSVGGFLKLLTAGAFAGIGIGGAALKAKL